MSDYRREALRELLNPIVWPASSGIRWRKEWVQKRREQVRLVLPFLNEAESQLAREWLANEKHEGLWE